MEDSDRERFLILVSKTADFYRVDRPPAMLQGYWATLKQYPLQWIAEAMTACMGDHKFMPKPAEIKERMASLESQRPAAGPALPPGEVVRDTKTIAKWLKDHEPETLLGSKSERSPDPQEIAEWIEDNPSQHYWDATVSETERNRRFWAWRAERNRSHAGAKAIPWEKFKEAREKERRSGLHVGALPRRIQRRDVVVKPDDDEDMEIPF